MGESSSSTIAVAMYLALYILLSALFFFWLATILYRCYRRSHDMSAGAATVGPSILIFEIQDGMPRGGLGLEAAVINTFPKFRFSGSAAAGRAAAADAHMTMTTTMTSSSCWECSVCLGVFEEDEIVRMLPKCGHVFHAECVDTWLRLHATCPFCRANLLPPPPPDRTGGDVTDGD